jgi:hypothetical protein
MTTALEIGATTISAADLGRASGPGRCLILRRSPRRGAATEEAKAAVADLAARAAQIHVAPCDIADRHAVERLFEHAAAVSAWRRRNGWLKGRAARRPGRAEQYIANERRVLRACYELESVRRQIRWTLCPVSLPGCHYVQCDRRQARKAEFIRSCRRNIDNPTFGEWSAIVDAYYDRLSVFQISDANECSER